MQLVCRRTHDARRLVVADGGAILKWWDGDGAARVYALESEAVLMERVEGPRSLVEMARDGFSSPGATLSIAGSPR
jgi:streptomycin 6-kinase